MNTIATWTITLDVECPGCGADLDLLDDPEFLQSEELQIGEHETNKSRGISIECPECRTEFLVDLVY